MYLLHTIYLGIGRLPIIITGAIMIILSLTTHALMYLTGVNRQIIHLPITFLQFFGIGLVIFKYLDIYIYIYIYLYIYCTYSWVYAAEILTVKGMSLSNAINWTVGLIIAASYYVPVFTDIGFGIFNLILAGIICIV